MILLHVSHDLRCIFFLDSLPLSVSQNIEISGVYTRWVGEGTSELSTYSDTDKIPTVIIGENQTFKGAEDLFAQHGVELINLESEKCKQLMKDFIADRPDLWNEDIGL